MAPSNLGRYPTPQSKFYATQRAMGLAPKVASVHGPWGGYVPDLEPRLLDYRSALDMYGLVATGEVLTYDHGWVRYQGDASLLPLGVTGANVPAVGATATIPLPVVGLARWLRQDSPANPQENLAILCGQGVGTGYLVAFPDAGAAWAIKLPTGGGPRIADTGEALFDWDNYAFGLRPGGATVTGLFLFTNNVDPMCYYPNNAAATEYEAFPNAIGSILTKSLAVWGERLFIFNNAIGAGARQPLELRWTTAGWSAPANAVWTGVGSGALSLNELSGVGLRVLPMRDVLACYTSDGVAFAYRTGQATAPIQREYLSKTRGLLGTRAVCDVGGGVHFGIFEDGWFLLDSNGQWTELGLLEKDGVVMHKWANTFYESLDFSLKDRISVEYDEVREYIYISWPDKDARNLNPGGGNGRNNKVWIFDLKGNRLFPDRYDLGYPNNYTAVCWGRFQEVGQASVTWATAVGPWTAPQWQFPWLQFSNPSRTQRLVHGTARGLVFEHDPMLVTRDGTLPLWYYSTHWDPLGDPTTLKTLDRLWLEYVQTASPTLVSVQVGQGGSPTQQIRAVLLGNTTPGMVAMSPMSFRLSATHPHVQLSGYHPLVWRGAHLQYLTPGALKVLPKAIP